MSKIKKEISIGYLKTIAKEELGRYVDDRLNEKTLRETIWNELEVSGKDIIFKSLGLRYDNWHHKWELDSYGTFDRLFTDYKPLVQKIGTEILYEIIKDIKPQDVLSLLTQPDKNRLKKTYKDNLMKYFEEEVRFLAQQHGKEHAKKLFEEYLNEDETN